MGILVVSRIFACLHAGPELSSRAEGGPNFDDAMLSSMTSIARGGIADANRRLDDSARRVAAGDADQAREAVEQITSTRAVDANVRVLRVADEMLGTVLDLLG